MHRDLLEELPVHQEVVDADRVMSFERVLGRRDLVVALEPLELGEHRAAQLGLDRVLDDRVAVACDGGCVRVEVDHDANPGMCTSSSLIPSGSVKNTA